MSTRLVLALVTAAVLVFALGVNHLVAAKAASHHHSAQTYRDYPGAMDPHRPCPPSAETWCRAAGGLAE